jgi:hypothetical protein
MTKKKPTKAIEQEKVCENLRAALHAMIDEEAKMKKQIEKLEEQLTMSVGVIKYLEMKLERPNSV